MSLLGLSASSAAPSSLASGEVPAVSSLAATLLFDAFFFVAGEPAAVITTLADAMPISLLPVADKSVDRVLTRFPFFTRHTIPAGTYKGVAQIETISVMAQWLVSATVDATLVYGITKALWSANTRRQLDRGHPEGRRITLATAREGVILPLHPGAERYYREAKIPAKAPEKTPSEKGG